MLYACIRMAILPLALVTCIVHLEAETLPELANFQFDQNRWRLHAWPAHLTDKIRINPEAEYQGQNTVEISHLPPEQSTCGHCTISLRKGETAPGMLEISFYSQVVTPDERDAKKYSVSLAFIKKGGGNGSAGRKEFQLVGMPEWKKETLYCELPQDAVMFQCVFGIGGSEKTLRLNNLRFGYAPDQISIPVAEQAELNAPLSSSKRNWSQQLSGFYEQCRPESGGTRVQLAADASGLYVAFSNQGMPVQFSMPPPKLDQELWLDDCNELFLFNPADGRGWHFIVNPAGALFDGILYQKQDGDPWQTDAKWNCSGLKASASKTNDEWQSRLFIPWEAMNLKLSNPIELGVNFARENKLRKEDVTWNCARGKFNNPKIFGTLTVENGKLSVRRFRNDNQMVYTIKRANQEFASLLQPGIPGNYSVGAWSHGAFKTSFPKAMLDHYGNSEFIRWQSDLMREWGESHMSGPAFPWSQNYLEGGAAAIIELNRKYSMKFPYELASSDHERMARKNGATLLLARAYPKVSPLDQEFRKIILSSINKIPDSKHYELMKKYTEFIMGVDEPFNCIDEIFSATLHPDAKQALSELDAKIRTKFGFGKYGIPDDYGSFDPEIEFKRIAFYRWANADFLEASIEWRDALRKVFPGVPYKMATNNTCAGLSPLDYSLFNESDILACDPYPTSSSYRYGNSRALYHTGFNVRLLRDLAPAPKLLAMPQCFVYCQGTPVTSDIREWASQAMKNGADGLMWYADYAYINLFEPYKAMLELNRIIAKMDKIKFPSAPVTGILLSNYDQSALNDKAVNSLYCLYSILGEYLKSNFRFVSATGVVNGVTPLAGLKLLYVPRLTWSDPQLTASLVTFVRDGGCLISFDPRFLSWNIDGSKIAERETLIGMLETLRIKNDTTTIIMKGRTLPATQNETLQLPTGMKVESYVWQKIGKGKVIATYPDDTPAAIENAFGKGRVICFAIQPFGNAELAANPGDWKEFFHYNAKSVGEQIDLPIWDFMLPETTGSISLIPFGGME